MKKALAVAWLCACLSLARPAFAQMDVGAGVGPDVFAYGNSKYKRKLPPPLGLAVGLVLDTGTWLTIGVSTAIPARDLDSLLQKGYYKLELIQLALMANETKSTLFKLTGQRDKGSGLRVIAEGLKLDYDAIYDRSLKLGRLVDQRLEDLSRVSVFVDKGKPGNKP